MHVSSACEDIAFNAEAAEIAEEEPEEFSACSAVL